MTTDKPRIDIVQEPVELFTNDMATILSACFDHKADNDFNVDAWDIGRGLFLTDNEDGTFSLYVANEDEDGNGFHLMHSGPTIKLWRNLICFWQASKSLETLSNMATNYLEAIADGWDSAESADSVIEIYS